MQSGATAMHSRGSVYDAHRRRFPAPVERFRRQVREADAVLFGK